MQDWKKWICLSWSRGIGASILGVEKTNPEFPLGFYEGVSILIHVPMATKSLEQMFPDLVKQIY